MLDSTHCATIGRLIFARRITTAYQCANFLSLPTKTVCPAYQCTCGHRWSGQPLARILCVRVRHFMVGIVGITLIFALIIAMCASVWHCSVNAIIHMSTCCAIATHIQCVQSCSQPLHPDGSHWGRQSQSQCQAFHWQCTSHRAKGKPRARATPRARHMPRASPQPLRALASLFQ